MFLYEMNFCYRRNTQNENILQFHVFTWVVSNTNFSEIFTLKYTLKRLLRNFYKLLRFIVVFVRITAQFLLPFSFLLFSHYSRNSKMQKKRNSIKILWRSRKIFMQLKRKTKFKSLPTTKKNYGSLWKIYSSYLKENCSFKCI